MSSLTMKPTGEIALPSELRLRYGLNPETKIRVVETRSGILLIPLTDAPMDPVLLKELEEWQALGAASGDIFPYEEDRP